MSSRKTTSHRPIFHQFNQSRRPPNYFSFPFACRIKYSNSALSFNGHERQASHSSSSTSAVGTERTTVENSFNWSYCEPDNDRVSHIRLCLPEFFSFHAVSAHTTTLFVTCVVSKWDKDGRD